jgi:hypothetical protein
MAQIVLYEPSATISVGEVITGAVAEHVRVNGKRQDAFAKTLHEFVKAIRRERAALLRCEHPI